ncbi:MAG TPA: presenilin family intramembrane aspartyl protease, partial [Thermoplasmata archaeon]|nr:presenilin family intramembrane aspartyl protease [Thermoplasmata archaeon]
MRREYASIAAMAAILVGSQILAIALSPLFFAGGFQAFPNPGDVTNTAIYIVMILAFTAVILGLVRYRRQNLAKYVIMASIFLTLAFILLLPLYFGLLYASGGAIDGDLLVNVSTLISFVLAGLIVYVLVKFPEWYVVDAVGIMTAAGVTAILGISF